MKLCTHSSEAWEILSKNKYFWMKSEKFNNEWIIVESHNKDGFSINFSPILMSESDEVFYYWKEILPAYFKPIEEPKERA